MVNPHLALLPSKSAAVERTVCLPALKECPGKKFAVTCLIFTLSSKTGSDHWTLFCVSEGDPM